LQEGIGELFLPEGVIEYAVSRAERFAALRLSGQWPKTKAFLPDGSLELFFLNPASSPPRLAARFSTNNSEVAEDAGLLTNSLFLDFQEQVFQEVPAQSLPGFLECVALLASQGDVRTSQAAMVQSFEELRLELDYYRQLAKEQNSEIDELRRKLRAKYAPAAEDESTPEQPGQDGQPPALNDLSLLPQWAKDNEHRIVIHPRALNGAKKSQYESPAAIFAGLEALAGPYRDQRLGIGKKDAFNKALEAAGIQLSGSTTRTTAGYQGEEYFVQWGGRKRFMDLHLLKGGGREERYCMRIYFFWDSESGRVVVGSLPAHLSNTLS
jgi:hypothetical protein